MDRELNLTIVLERPTAGVDYGLQKGRGNDYETVQTQRGATKDLTFELSVRVNEGKNGKPNFLGPFAQGNADGRFVYLDIGTYAGQKNTGWARRLKIPLMGIEWTSIDSAIEARKPLEARVAGSGGRDGGPTCGTIKPFTGWHVRT
ncbi:MAG TPA: DUF5990 family protein [Pyrinomonadaceae bacterium]|nr:DUF5990 family protein [Pyrinomonadaceae bacterium]